MPPSKCLIVWYFNARNERSFAHGKYVYNIAIHAIFDTIQRGGCACATYYKNTVFRCQFYSFVNVHRGHGSWSQPFFEGDSTPASRKIRHFVILYDYIWIIPTKWHLSANPFKSIEGRLSYVTLTPQKPMSVIILFIAQKRRESDRFSNDFLFAFVSLCAIATSCSE